MKRYQLFLVICGLLAALVLLPMIALSQQDYGVRAEAVGQANLRSTPSLDGALVGEIFAGTVYPVIGRSARFPWVLLGDPTTFQPLGWVFQDLVTITGNVNVVPVSEVDVNALPTPTPISTLDPSLNVLPTTEGQTQLEQPAVTESVDPQVNPNVTPGAAAQGGDSGVPTLTPTLNASVTVTGTVNGEVNVRYGPGTDYAILGTVFAGDLFEVTGYHTQFPWLQVRYPNSPNGFAWIAQELLDVTGDVFSLPPISTIDFNLPTLTPTPSMLQSSNFPGVGESPLSPEFALLGEAIWNDILDSDFVPGTGRFGALYIQDLQTGEAMTFGNQFAFSGTSINKIAILVEYFGTISAAPTINEAVDIANTMICSENVATNRLLSVIGGGDELSGAENTTDFLRQLGLQRTFLTAPYDTRVAGIEATPLPRAVEVPVTDADQQSANPNPTNQMTVEELGWLMSSIYQCGYEESGPLIDLFSEAFTPQECRKMVHVMSNNTVDALLRAGVPAEIPVAHKHGWIEDTHGNAAMFFTPGGDYIIVMMLHEPGFLQYPVSLPIIANASREVFNFYNTDNQLAEPREGFIPEVGECNYTATDQLVNDLASPFFLNDLATSPLFDGDSAQAEATEEPQG